MKRVARIEVWVGEEGWRLTYELEGEPAHVTTGWRSLLTALDQVGKVIAQRVSR